MSNINLDAIIAELLTFKTTTKELIQKVEEILNPSTADITINKPALATLLCTHRKLRSFEFHDLMKSAGQTATFTHKIVSGIGTGPKTDKSAFIKHSIFLLSALFIESMQVQIQNITNPACCGCFAFLKNIVKSNEGHEKSLKDASVKIFQNKIQEVARKMYDLLDQRIEPAKGFEIIMQHITDLYMVFNDLRFLDSETKLHFEAEFKSLYSDVLNGISQIYHPYKGAATLSDYVNSLEVPEQTIHSEYKLPRAGEAKPGPSVTLGSAMDKFPELHISLIKIKARTTGSRKIPAWETWDRSTPLRHIKLKDFIPRMIKHKIDQKLAQSKEAIKDSPESKASPVAPL